MFTPIAGKVRERLLTIKLNDYIELVDWTDRQIVRANKTSVPIHLAPIFERLNLRQDQWLNQIKSYGSNYHRAVGHLDKLKEKIKDLEQHWFKGIKSVQRFYANPSKLVDCKT